MRLLPAHDRPEVAWRNGAGVTTEVTSWPSGSGDAFGWRISIATIAASGPFSRYAGVDRLLLPLGSTLPHLVEPVGSVDLVVSGRRHAMEPWVPFAFDGQADTHAQHGGAGVQVLNVMTRRAAWRADIEVVTLGRSPAALSPRPFGGHSVLVVLDGSVNLASSSAAGTLGALDAASLSGLAAVHLCARPDSPVPHPHVVHVRLSPSLPRDVTPETAD
ncbi:MAG: HutD family protein [Knoellia sp.]